MASGDPSCGGSGPGNSSQLACPTPGIEAELRGGTGGGGYETYQINQQLRSPEQDGFIAAAIRVL